MPALTKSCTAATGISWQELTFLIVWAGPPGAANALRCANLLLCAHELELRLQSCEQTGGTQVLTALQQRLACAALAPDADHCGPQHPASEACAASAAAALVMRMRGDLQARHLRVLHAALGRSSAKQTLLTGDAAPQALRAFVCDLVLAAQQDACASLPRLAAALDAWPQALPPVDTDGMSQLWDAAADTRGREHSECGVAVLHTALQGLCAGHVSAGHQTAIEDADSEHHAMAQLAALCLRGWGQRQWGWQDDDADDPQAQRDRVSLVEALALLRTLRV